VPLQAQSNWRRWEQVCGVMMIANKKTTFQIKGFKEGLLITIRDGDWQVVTHELLNYMQDRESFFKGAKVALEVGDRLLSGAEVSSIRNQLLDHEVTLWALLCNGQHTKETAKSLGLEINIPSQQIEQKIKPIDTYISGENAIFLKKTLRSGYRVVNEGHVVVLGDVNPGAEIIAGGCVVVWGRLRGVVHAGAEGDEQAIICALDMMSPQLRIAAVVSKIPPRKGKPQPEIVSIKNSLLVAETWKL
jgi:septum site-determining protein MinC